MKSISIGNRFIDSTGIEWTLKSWIPGKGLFSIGTWLVKNKQGTMRFSSVELQRMGYNPKG